MHASRLKAAHSRQPGSVVLCVDAIIGVPWRPWQLIVCMWALQPFVNSGTIACSYPTADPMWSNGLMTNGRFGNFRAAP